MYRSIHQMILLCEKLDDKPILPIFCKINYGYLDLHIYFLLIYFHMDKKKSL